MENQRLSFSVSNRITPEPRPVPGLRSAELTCNVTFFAILAAETCKTYTMSQRSWPRLRRQRLVHCIKVPGAQLWRRCSHPKISASCPLALSHFCTGARRVLFWTLAVRSPVEGLSDSKPHLPLTGSRCPKDLWTMSARDVPNVHQLPARRLGGLALARS